MQHKNPKHYASLNYDEMNSKNTGRLGSIFCIRRLIDLRKLFITKEMTDWEHLDSYWSVFSTKVASQ